MSPTFVSAIVGVVLLLLLRGPSVDGHSSPLGHTDKVELLNEAMKLDWRQSLYDGVDRGEGITPSNDAPSQIRLSYIPNGMAISFSTIHPYQAPSEPTVHFGLQPANLGYTATAGENGLINDTYGTLYFHTVLLEMLAWNTTYFYQVDGNPTINSFVTARAPGDPTPFEVLLVGDMGLVNSGDNMKQMKAQVEQTDFYLHIGDISYADDFYLRPNNTYEGSWDTFQDLMEPVTANIPYMTLPGNHEVVCTEVSPFLCPANQNNMTAYRHRFRMPSKESGGTQNLWFSYDYGLVHFIHINTETDFPNAAMGPGTYFNAGPFGNQLQWLEADLIDAQIARQKGETAWIIVSGHRPLYSSKKNQAAVIAAFESLFAKYGVDIYFCGHVHTYERLWPLAEGGIATQQNYVNPTGVVHIVNGAGGNIEGHGQYTPKANSAFNDQSHFGYGRLHVANSSSINWKFFNSADAALIDDIWITKEL